MTQDDYRLWTNSSSKFNEDDFERIVDNASGRLASFLCLSSLPTDEDGRLPDDLQELLANFICSTLRTRGDDQRVASKRVRNFTITFRSPEATNVFNELASGFGDVITKYSQCGMGFVAERTKGGCCGCI